MSSQNVPIDYDKTIFANYNANANVTEYTDQNSKISSQRNNSQQIMMQNNTKNVYNPLYSPSDIIDNFVEHRQTLNQTKNKSNKSNKN